MKVIIGILCVIMMICLAAIAENVSTMRRMQEQYYGFKEIKVGNIDTKYQYVRIDSLSYEKTKEY